MDKLLKNLYPILDNDGNFFDISLITGEPVIYSRKKRYANNNQAAVARALRQTTDLSETGRSSSKS